MGRSLKCNVGVQEGKKHIHFANTVISEYKFAGFRVIYTSSGFRQILSQFLPLKMAMQNFGVFYTLIQYMIIQEGQKTYPDAWSAAGGWKTQQFSF